MGERFMEQRRLEELGLLWQAWRQEYEKALLNKGTSAEAVRRASVKMDNQKQLIAELEERLQEIPRLEEKLQQAHAEIANHEAFEAKLIDYAFRPQETDKDILRAAWRSWTTAMPTLRVETQ